jgi:hypothetical protein
MRSLPTTACCWVLLAGSAAAQPTIDWHTLDCGGGLASGGTLTLNATIGQGDAGPALVGGGYSLTGGLWGSSEVQPGCGSADFDGDGDVGTDADIEAFFACLGGSCCRTCGSADFDGDGDTGTDADIEAFFRVLGGGVC